MEDLNNSLFPVETPYLGKFFLTNYMPESFYLIRLQDSLIINITGRIAWISLIFCMEIKVAFDTTTFGSVSLGITATPKLA